MSNPSPLRSLVGMAAQLKLRLAGVRPPVVVPPVSGRQNMFIGPANSAGQGYAWARAVEGVTQGVSVTSMGIVRRDDRFAFPIDQRVPFGYAVHSKRWQRRQLAALRDYDVVVAESGLPLVGGRFGDLATQLRDIASGGARTALLFHGSDIRDPDRHLEAEPYSHFAVDGELTAALRGVARANQRLIADLQLPVFVSTPDLLNDVPTARWLPLVVETAQWVASTPAFAGDAPPVVAHIPSSSKLKGTELIMPTLRELAGASVVTLLPDTSSAHGDMPNRYRAADIVIDQMRAGSYGVAACEAMAAGRLVVSHVSDSVRRSVTELTGDELPILEATPDTLKEVLVEVSEHPARYRELAARGPQFVEKNHSGHLSGRVLAELFDTPSGHRAAGRDRR